MTPQNRSLIEIHIAVLFFGLAGLFGKLILLPPLVIVLGRVIFAAVFLALLSLYLKQSIKLNQKKDYLYLFIMGIILAFHWWAFFQAIRVSTIAVGLLTYSTFPIFVTFLEPYFFKEGVGDPNPFTVRQMPFFRSFISKVCRKNKVPGGISKEGGGTPNPFTVRQTPFFRSFISKVCQKNKVPGGISEEKIKRSDIFLALVTFLGVILVIPRFEIDNNITQGAVWGIASGFTFAVLSILNRKYVKKYSSLVIAFYQDSAAALVLLPFLFLMEFAFTIKDILLLALLGVCFTAVAHTLFIKGLTNVKTQTASIIACLEPVYGIVIAIFLLGEIPGLRVIFGGILILGTGFYVTIQTRKS
jgi:drug/metabolite transporter (DMT)-like permease